MFIAREIRFAHSQCQGQAIYGSVLICGARRLRRFTLALQMDVEAG
jgi:hypothetical protein